MYGFLQGNWIASNPTFTIKNKVEFFLQPSNNCFCILIRYTESNFFLIGGETLSNQTSTCQNRKYTITTGPFLVPLDAAVGQPNNRLVILIKNPTSKPLEADVVIEYCPSLQLSTEGISLPFITNENEKPFLEGLPLTVIPPRSCTRLEFDISSIVNGILHVKSTGDYLVGERPLRGRLEIEVVGGSGLSSPTNPGLSVADPSMIFHFGDMKVMLLGN